jgi:hypothetical protein
MAKVVTETLAAQPLERPLRAGDRVWLRSPTEILATLDENGCLDGLPFMPEMLRWFGRTYTVSAQAARACDTIGGDGPSGVRRLRETVVLSGLRCTGGAHGGCQAQCLLYWKEAWLRPAGEMPTATDFREDPAFSRLQELALAHVHAPETTPQEPVYKCQATELLRASEPVPRWSVSSFLHEVRSGNVGLWRFLRVTTGIVLYVVGRRLHLVRGSLAPFRPEELSDNPSPTPPNGLRQGDLVRVRSREEIAKTLNKTGKHKGLWFDREMESFCGHTARVKSTVDRIIDERNGRMIELKSEAYILDGVFCQSDRSDGRWFCPRAIYPYWRESWLEPIEKHDEVVASPTEQSRVPATL